MSNLTHTECQNCGAINNQEVEEVLPTHVVMFNTTVGGFRGLFSVEPAIQALRDSVSGLPVGTKLQVTFTVEVCQ